MVNDSIRARLAGYELPEGYGLIFGGEEESIQENSRQLRIVVFLAIFLVFVVMGTSATAAIARGRCAWARFIRWSIRC